MIRPILACVDPYKAAEDFATAGWNIDFSQPPESGDPLVGVSLFGNSVLLGVTEGYVEELTAQPWGDLAFEVKISGYQFMIAAGQG